MKHSNTHGSKDSIHSSTHSGEAVTSPASPDVTDGDQLTASSLLPGAAFQLIGGIGVGAPAAQWSNASVFLPLTQRKEESAITIQPV